MKQAIVYLRDVSFLPSEMKDSYKKLIAERLSRL